MRNFRPRSLQIIEKHWRAPVICPTWLNISAKTTPQQPFLLESLRRFFGDEWLCFPVLLPNSILKELFPSFQLSLGFYPTWLMQSYRIICTSQTDPIRWNLSRNCRSKTTTLSRTYLWLLEKFLHRFQHPCGFQFVLGYNTVYELILTENIGSTIYCTAMRHELKSAKYEEKQT